MKKPETGLTRRQLAAALAAATPALAQDAPKVDELAAAREQSKRTLAALRKFDVPMLVEPSFVFRP